MMALISQRKGRRADQTPSGYTRLFGISELGNLLSKTHGAGISAGTELETLIWERCNQIKNLDKFLAKTLHQKRKGIWIAHKKQVKESKIINSQYEPDFLAFDLINKICYVIEVKDGDQFDTKKAAGEHITLKNFTNDVSQALAFSFRIYICSFNAKTKKEIYNGLKRKFSMDEVLTGQELCALFQVNYNEILKVRTNDQQNNLAYFINEILKIPLIQKMIKKRLSGF